MIDENTHSLIEGHVSCEHRDQITPKGFVHPIQVYQVDDFLSEEHREKRQQLSRVGERVEVNVIDSWTSMRRSGNFVESKRISRSSTKKEGRLDACFIRGS